LQLALLAAAGDFAAEAAGNGPAGAARGQVQSGQIQLREGLLHHVAKGGGVKVLPLGQLVRQRLAQLANERGRVQQAPESLLDAAGAFALVARDVFNGVGGREKAVAFRVGAIHGFGFSPSPRLVPLGNADFARLRIGSAALARA